MHAVLAGIVDVLLNAGDDVLVERHVFWNGIHVAVDDQFIRIFFTEIFEPLGGVLDVIVNVK